MDGPSQITTGRQGLGGYVWLNRVFVKRERRFRPFGRGTDLRMSHFEVFVIGVMLLALGVVSLPVTAFLMRVDFISHFVNLWWFNVPVVFVISWFGGRRLAKASPYARFTGENIFDWLTVTADRKDSFLGRVVGKRVAVSQAESWISGRPQVVEVVEWLGSARVPYAPARRFAERGRATNDLWLEPRVEVSDWADAARRARLGLGGDE